MASQADKVALIKFKKKCVKWILIIKDNNNLILDKPILLKDFLTLVFLIKAWFNSVLGYTKFKI